MPIYSRKSPRLSNYDYSSKNYYFLTICTHQHKCILGKPNALNHFGRIAEADLLRISQHHSGVHLDKFVVMPNHIHAIVVIESQGCCNISQLVASYKTGVTKQIRAISPGTKVWQRSFYDHIIRNQHCYAEIWTYIDNNPLQWHLDKFYINE